MNPLMMVVGIVINDYELVKLAPHNLLSVLWAQLGLYSSKLRMPGGGGEYLYKWHFCQHCWPTTLLSRPTHWTWVLDPLQCYSMKNTSNEQCFWSIQQKNVNQHKIQCFSILCFWPDVKVFKKWILSLAETVCWTKSDTTLYLYVWCIHVCMFACMLAAMAV